MNNTALRLPTHVAKPRTSGLTMVIDGGIPLGLFTDQIAFGAEMQAPLAGGAYSLVLASAPVVPSLKGRNVARVQKLLKHVHCGTVSLIIPKTRKGQKVVFSTSNPRAGHHVAAGHVVKVTFKIKKPTKK